MQAGNKVRCKQLLLTVIALSLMTLRYVNGADLENQQKALNIISDFADRICARVPLEGEKGKLSGQAKADLSSILRQLVGLEVIATAESEHYKGILQHELAKVITESNDCRLAVSRELINKLLEPQSGPSPPPKQTDHRFKQPPPTPGVEEMVRCKIGEEEFTVDSMLVSSWKQGRIGLGYHALALFKGRNSASHNYANTWGSITPYDSPTCLASITPSLSSSKKSNLPPRLCLSTEGVITAEGTKFGYCETCNPAGEDCHALHLTLE